MLQIKIISFPNATDVEESFKNWVFKTNCKIEKIDYSTSVDNCELWHNLLIIYAPGNDE